MPPWSWCLPSIWLATVAGHFLKICQLLLLQDVTQKDFKLPKLGPKLIEFRDEAINGRGFVLLRGLPVQDWAVEEVATAYWGMGTYWGKAQPQNRLHHLLGHVKVSIDNVHSTMQIMQTAGFDQSMCIDADVGDRAL